jgi:hypothetical protein
VKRAGLTHGGFDGRHFAPKDNLAVEITSRVLTCDGGLQRFMAGLDGALMLARAVDDPKLSEGILDPAATPSPALKNRSRKVSHASFTFSARGPLGPWPISNVTACPSRNESNRSPTHAL